jgi:hypothetical protein
MILSYGTANQVQFLNGSKQLVGDADLTFDGTTLSTTNFTSSGNITLSGGTANGVAYLNGSKVLTTGSALTFDGTNLVVGGSAIEKFTTNGNIASTAAQAYIYSNGGSGSSVNSGFLLSGSDNTLRFYTGNSEQMRLTGTGLLVGTTSSITGNTYGIQVKNGMQVQYGSNNNLEIFSPNSGTGIRLLARNNAGTLNRLELQGGQVIFPLTSGADGMYFDASSGNLGLGVTPSAWLSAFKAFELQAGALSGISTSEIELSQNGFYSASTSSWAYKNTAAASQYRQNSGQHIWLNAPSGTAGAAISFTQAMTLTSGGTLQVGNATANIIQMFHNQSVGYIETAGTSATPIGFATSGSERMRIDSDGNLLVGTTTNAVGERIRVNGSSSSEYVAIFRTNASTNVGYYVFQKNDGTQVGYISTSASATAYNTSSDYRLKENIRPMQNALAFCRKQRPVTYDWRADGSKGSGYIAHWMQEDGAGNCVTGEKDAVDKDGKPVYQGIDTSFMVAPLNAGLNELADIVEKQVKLIEALTARVAQLEGK